MGDINLLDRINRLAKKIGNAITSSDKATKSKFGIVKIGNGINVSSGVISVPATTGFNVDTLYSGSEETVNNFTFPTGKTLADYNFILLVVESSGEDHDCISTLIPAEWVVASQVVYTTLNYDATYKIKVKIEPTKTTKYSGYTSYYINKVYAF